MMLPGDIISVPVRTGNATTGWLPDATVIASSVFNDDGPVIQTLLLLHPQPPFFQAAVYNPDEGMVAAELSERVENIGQALRQYEDFGGDVVLT